MRRAGGRGRGAIGLAIGATLATLAIGPLLALGPASVIDRGARGEARWTVLHLALTAWDPFIANCARNSLAGASLAAAGSLIVGVAIARPLARWRFRGRAWWLSVVWTPLVIPPLFAATGLRHLLGLALPASRGDGWGEWVCWVWVGILCGAPWVGLRVFAALARLEPAWEDSARLAGASRWRIWRDLTWPVIRPGAARATATVFALTLFEPGAPLALGLRRTLAFQAVEAATQDQPPRAASLCLLALLLASVGRLLIRWWGGASIPPAAAPAVPRPRSALGYAALAIHLPLAGWMTLALIPIIGLVSAATSMAAFGELFVDPETRLMLFHSLLAGATVGGVGLLLGRLVALRGGRRRPDHLGPARRVLHALADRLGTVPPLAFGVGVLMVPTLLSAAAAFGDHGSQEKSGPWLRAVAEGLDPYRSPGVLLVWDLAIAHLPLMPRGGSLRWAATRPELVDSAIVLGGTKRQARRVSAGSRLASPLTVACLLASVLAATDAGPALVLAPTSQSWTVGPGSLVLRTERGDGPRRAAALALIAVALNLVTFALVGRSRSAPLTDWLRDRTANTH